MSSKSAMAKRRDFITPEGVALNLTIASAGSRLAALVIDLILIGLTLLLFTIAAGFLLAGSRSLAVTGIIWLLGFFVLRNGYFLGFELGKRAATPGKRLVGIRVVARDGGRLTADAVVARNLIRELEIFLPLTFLAVDSSEGAVGGLMMVLGLLWALCLSLFLFFNKDRMRMGDLIAGTWVVDDQRRKLKQTVMSVATDERLVFTREELSVYGIYELQELERIVRERDPKAMAAVAETIRGKIGRTSVQESDEDFLNVYYSSLRAHLERDLLFGKRRENKYQAAT